MDLTDFIDVERYVLPFGIAVVLAVLALIGLRDLRSRKGAQVRAQGEIFDHMIDADTFTPKIRFTAADGRSYEFLDGFGVSKTPVSPGSRVTVIYPEGAPANARVDHPAKRAIAYAILLGLLAILIAIYIGILT